MCGLTGYWNFTSSDPVELKETVAKMAQQLHSRGPDSNGQWVDERVGLAFGHNRLAIVDLSPLGHQPMISQSGRWVLSYNGEVYNAPDLRQELIALGSTFRGNSDTEVIIEACERWGIQKACERFVGMFAFALWDRENQELTLVRDRLGIKPMYYGFNHEIFFFGSQLKSFKPHPKWSADIDPHALSSFFRLNYIPAPLSIYKDVFKLSPGSILTVDVQKKCRHTLYWSAEKQYYAVGIDNSKTDNERIDELEGLVKSAVSIRLLSDVPVGAFLSGGIDSSLVVAIMQSLNSKPIKTFSIGFSESEFNEAPYAAAVAKHLRTEHHEVMLSLSDAQKIIPELSQWYDEPFADVSQIPTYLVSKIAREHVTVALSGDGGDEVFAGYTRYQLADRIWQKIFLLPQWSRSFVAKGVTLLSPDRWTSLSSHLPRQYRYSEFGDKVYRLMSLMDAQSFEDLYGKIISQWPDPSKVLKKPLDAFDLKSLGSSGEDKVKWMQYIDMISYLPDDILTKVDRASMAVSLEARVPLLDHRLVQWAGELPLHLKRRNQQSKWILRQVLYRYVPQKLIERPKQGFGVPIGSWLRSSLKDWSADLLSKERLESQGLNAEFIQQCWQEHLSGHRNWQYSLWGVLMFQSWLTTQ